jgi:hypothetical protein
MVYLRRAFREYQSVVGGIHNADECRAAFLAIKSIAFKSGRVDVGSFAATEI